MSRYIDADKVLKELHLNYKDVIYIDKNDTAKRIEKIPSIDLADYVPKDFHDKTCEAMAKRHQEEIASMPDIVRCSECENLKIYNTKELYAECRKWHIRFYPFMEDTRTHGCSWGERSE